MSGMEYGVEPLFAVPLISGMLPDFAEHQAELVSALRKLRSDTPYGVKRANRGVRSWHSSTDIFDDFYSSRIPTIDKLKQRTYAFIHDALSAFQKPPFPPITESWIVIAGQGAWHTPHTHAQRGAWSGVIYIDVEKSLEGQGREPGDLSGKMEILSPLSVSGAFFSAPSKVITPKDGMILLFPGALMHFVHPNASEVERVVVSFNMFPRTS